MASKWPSKQVIQEEIKGAERRKREEDKLIAQLRQDLATFDIESNGGVQKEELKKEKRPVEEVARL